MCLCTTSFWCTRHHMLAPSASVLHQQDFGFVQLILASGRKWSVTIDMRALGCISVTKPRWQKKSTQLHRD